MPKLVWKFSSARPLSFLQLLISVIQAVARSGNIWTALRSLSNHAFPAPMPGPIALSLPTAVTSAPGTILEPRPRG